MGPRMFGWFIRAAIVGIGIEVGRDVYNAIKSRVRSKKAKENDQDGAGAPPKPGNGHDRAPADEPSAGPH